MTHTGKGTLYSRFIPGEEVEEIASWRFDVFTPQDVAHRGDPAQRQGAMRSFDAPASATAAPATPPEQLPGYAQGLEAGRAAGYDAGLQDGLHQLMLFKQQQGQAQAQRLDSLARQFTAQLQGVEQHIAESIVAIALDVARQVVRTQVRTDPQAVLPVAQEAIRSVVVPSSRLLLRVHPDDLAVVREHVDTTGDGRALQWQADPAVSPGGCVLQTDSGEVDGRIETRWARAVAALGHPEAPFESPTGPGDAVAPAP